MFVEISIGIAVFIFTLLAFYLIWTLIALRHTLLHVNNCLKDVENKLVKVDPLLHSLSNLGEISEHKTLELKNRYFDAEEKQSRHPQAEFTSSQTDFTSELAEWLLLSATLGQKFFKSKRR